MIVLIVVMGVGVGFVVIMVSIFQGVLWWGLLFLNVDWIVVIGCGELMWQFLFDDLEVFCENGWDVLQSVGGYIVFFNFVMVDGESMEGLIGFYVMLDFF